MQAILEIKNISKKYRINENKQPYLSLRDSLSTLFNKGFSSGKEDFWALNDISFDVYPGDTVGIIGKNGAGKSTLLKVLSRITPPTLGNIKVRGRVASLLEVGTGFHAELSGKENIFLNGSILGMKRNEIQKNFDEIVDFSGVEKFIDTPLKHYSSGMQLRLAFAVAAFLENEILIIDEVLAVGDAEFQKKCMNKMGDVSKSGRTILFVSHNLEAIQNLCNTGLLMQNGKLMFSGSISNTVNEYISKFLIQETERSWNREKAPGNNYAKLLKAQVSNSNTNSFTEFKTSDGFCLELVINNLKNEPQQLDITYHLINERGVLVNVASTGLVNEPRNYEGGIMSIKTFFPGNILNEGTYTFSRILLILNRGQVLTEWNDVLSFEVLSASNGELGWNGNKEGVIKLKDLHWEITTTEND